MNEVFSSIVNRISSYQILNFLYPGVLFMGVMWYGGLREIFSYNIFIILVFSYFAGMTISRIGSIVIETLLLKSQILSKIDYKHLSLAESKDTKVDLLLSLCNTYRTLAALCLTLLIIFITDIFCTKALTIPCWLYLTTLLLFILYLVSFCKQYNYVYKRVEIHKQ